MVSLTKTVTDEINTVEKKESTAEEKKVEIAKKPIDQLTVKDIFGDDDFSYETFVLSQSSLEEEDEEGECEGKKLVEIKSNDEKEKKEEKKSATTENGKLKTTEGNKDEESTNVKKERKSGQKRAKRSEVNEDGEEEEHGQEKKRQRLQELTGELIEKMTEIIVLQNHTF